MPSNMENMETTWPQFTINKFEYSDNVIETFFIPVTKANGI